MNIMFESCSFLEDLNGQKVIGIRGVREIASLNGLTVLEVEIAALRNKIIPRRYIANTRFIGIDGQIKLLGAKAAIAGCGALGGVIAELLARLGIGHITVIDFDFFEESNLNRQIVCTERNLGESKAFCAKERIAEINSAVCVHAKAVMLTKANSVQLISNSDVVLDAFDGSHSKIVLEDACLKSGVPLIHGALGNSQFQVASIRNNSLIGNIYAGAPDDCSTGTPACTVAACAAVQVGEALKVLLNIGDIYDGAILRCDWLFWDSKVIEL